MDNNSTPGTSSTSTSTNTAAAGKDAQPFKVLERKIADLIHLCDQFNSENRKLKVEALSWQHEREQLIQKTEMARSKVEAMIQRLKALEQES
jgi:cell division protein ZapB